MLNTEQLSLALDILKDALKKEESNFLSILCRDKHYSARSMADYNLDEKYRAIRAKAEKSKRILETRITLFELENEDELNNPSVYAKLKEIKKELSDVEDFIQKIDKCAKKIKDISDIVTELLNSTVEEISSHSSTTDTFSDPQDSEPLTEIPNSNHGWHHSSFNFDFMECGE